MLDLYNYFTVFILIYFVILSSGYTLFLLATVPELLRQFKETEYGNMVGLINRDCLLPLTVVVPAFNEKKRVFNTIYNLLKSDYKKVNIIVVNDGSTDNTMDLLIKEFALYEVPLVIKQTLITAKIKHQYKSKRYKNLTVLDKEHWPLGCPSDSVNAGLNACRTPVMLTIDADTVLEPTALSRVLFTFLSKYHCVAVGGAVYVLNDNKVEHGKLITENLPRGSIAAMQSLEYIRSFLYGRAGWNLLGGALCYAGAFTLFETQALREVGGFDRENFSYDVEIIMKLHQEMRLKNYPHRLYYTPDAFAWTVVPDTLKSFWRQRYHWQRGMLRSTDAHLSMFLNPRYGIVGLLGFPYYVIFEVFGPFIEFVSYILLVIGIWMGLMHWNIVFWYVTLAWGYIGLLSITTFLLNIVTFNKFNKPFAVFRIVWLSFLEIVGFRQFRAMCCFYSTLQYCFNRLLGKNQ